MFQSAANAFKLDKLFVEAGDAHSREAECREKSGEDNEAANAWWNASKAYKQGNNLECKQSLICPHYRSSCLFQWPSRRCAKP